MSKYLIITSTMSRNHNSGVMFTELRKHFIGQPDFINCEWTIPNCNGCKFCCESGYCRFKDECSSCIQKPFTDLVIISPVYFFGIRSNVMKVIERLYCKDLSGINIHLILFTGSKGRYSGLNVIRKQFKLIDEYCGTHTHIWNKVTNDKLCVSLSDVKSAVEFIGGVGFEVSEA